MAPFVPTAAGESPTPHQQYKRFTMRRCFAFIIFAFAVLILATPSHAHTRPHHHDGFHRHSHAVERGLKTTHHKQHRRHVKSRSRSERQDARDQVRSAQTVAHPGGCPSTSFCGCGVALHVFGHHVRRLWLASNWLSFPRANPAPGMVAVRRGHVFAIIETKGHGKVLAYDPNSGRHRTRIHLRSLAGFKVVNPHGGTRYAQASRGMS
jgi:hypothetical protein